MIKCPNCNKTVNYKRKYNKGLFIILLFLMFPLAIVQYVIAPKVCNECGLEL